MAAKKYMCTTGITDYDKDGTKFQFKAGDEYTGPAAKYHLEKGDPNTGPSIREMTDEEAGASSSPDPAADSTAKGK